MKGGLGIDGKTVRRSGSDGETAIQMVRACATELGVVLGQQRHLQRAALAPRAAPIAGTCRALVPFPGALAVALSARPSLYRPLTALLLILNSQQSLPRMISNFMQAFRRNAKYRVTH